MGIETRKCTYMVKVVTIADLHYGSHQDAYQHVCEATGQSRWLPGVCNAAAAVWENGNVGMGPGQCMLSNLANVPQVESGKKGSCEP